MSLETVEATYKKNEEEIHKKKQEYLSMTRFLPNLVIFFSFFDRLNDGEFLLITRLQFLFSFIVKPIHKKKKKNLQYLDMNEVTKDTRYFQLNWIKLVNHQIMGAFVSTLKKIDFELKEFRDF